MKNFIALVLGAGVLFAAAADAVAGDRYYGSMKDAPAEVAAAGWSGIHVGAAIGYSWTDYGFTHDLDFDCGGCTYAGYVFPGPYDVTTRSSHESDSITGTVTLGYDHQVGGKFVVGVFADYTFGDESTVGRLFYPGGSEGVSFSYDNAWAIGGRVGFLVKHGTLVYFNAGYTQAQFEMVSLAGNGFLKKDIGGYFLGAGAVHKLHEGLALTFEYRYSGFGNERIGSYSDACCYEAFDVDVDNHAVRVGLAFHLSKPTPVHHEPMK